MKKKILIYIDDDIYIRNYFTYSSFDLSRYKLAIYANNNINQKYLLKLRSDFKGFITDSPKRGILRYNLQCNLQLMKYINKFKSFRFRYNRYPKRVRFVLRVLSLPIINSVVDTTISLILGDNEEVTNMLLKEKPDLIIVPSQVVGTISMDIIESAKKLRIKTLFLIDGWDNISSKTVFPVQPTYLAVWGKQSLEHAVDIQKFPKRNIFTIGTPRFEPYFSEVNKKPPYHGQYIVFTGCSIPFDEITALKIIDLTLVKNNIQDIKIIYRPHPWRMKRNCFDYFIGADFKYVIIDEQIKDYYYYLKTIGTRYATALQPPLDYYPSLLKYALFTISPLTTMIIEAAIMNKYVLTLAYDDHIHYTNPLNALKNYEHFKGIEKINAFKFCYNLDNLPEIFLSLLKAVRPNSQKKDFSSEIKYIIDINKLKYSQRLDKIISQII